MDNLYIPRAKNRSVTTTNYYNDKGEILLRVEYNYASKDLVISKFTKSDNEGIITAVPIITMNLENLNK